MNGDNAYIVEFNGVSLNYHDAQGETPAIRGLDFGVKKGEFVSIVGPSGCGKTSVLSIAAGIAVPGQCAHRGRQAGLYAATGPSAGLAHGGREHIAWA